jgi:3-mercaptopyruvate sulfurtransferase SseA
MHALGCPDDKDTVNFDQVKRMIETKSALMLDVRSAKEYAEGRMPSAVNIPGYWTNKKILFSLERIILNF